MATADQSPGPQTGGRPALSPPSISVPKGGGAIRGIGEKFAANPVTGTGSLSVPLFTSPGRSNFFPQLSLGYDSGSGNGPFGVGWSLSIPAITRKTDKGLPRYRDDEQTDTFILSGAEDLVPELVERNGQWITHAFLANLHGVAHTVQRYRPRIEGLFARIERWRDDATGDVHWKTISRDNVASLYGQTANSRISDPDDASRVFTWLLDTTYDDKGNVVTYEYKAEDQVNVTPSLHERARKVGANRYVKRIKYGNRVPYQPAVDPPLPTDWLFQVVFDYGEHDLAAPSIDERVSWPARVDAFSTYRAGFEIRTYRLCQRVLMFHQFRELGPEPYLVRSTDIEYSYEKDLDHARNPIYSFVASVTQTGYIREANGSYRPQSLPPLEFTYSEAAISDEVRFVDAQSVENLPIGLDGATYHWIDLDSEGSAGVLTQQADAWFYKRNVSGAANATDGVAARFEAAAVAVATPSVDKSAGQYQLIDLAGDGQLCLVKFGVPMAGFHERTRDEDWGPFTPFAFVPNLDWSDPNLRFIDLDGDGHADVLITGEQIFTWYESLGKEGFGRADVVPKPSDEDAGPALVFADASESIRLADFSGDGLTDIVRIRNGEVCYWPNLGHGRFGAKITMDRAPLFDHPDQFDQKRIRLADIDGSGTTDIIYLGREHITLWFNQAGNSWSVARTLPQLPESTNLSSVAVVDLLGNGTACIVWSSLLPGDDRRPMRYLDLMGGRKPHLLVSVVNNLGAEVHVEYVASTTFYLKDRRANRPWIAKLPFPVHVVERVRTFDSVSHNRFVTRYAYHHGYFDGVEREFRGFGMVEQWDTEEFAALQQRPELSASANIDRSSYVAPVHTKTWFHNGAHISQDNISRHFAHEYYAGDADASLLPDTILPPGLTAAEQRQASRALKGSVLRQEIYADDDSDKRGHPYSVTEHAYQIRRLQPAIDNRHAVFHSFESESLTYSYERAPGDSRVTHQLTLEVDTFGNVVKAAAVGYARRAGAGQEPEQQQTLITYSERRVTNRPEELDWYRIGVAIETRTYEMTGLEQRQPLTIDGLTTALEEATDIPYEGVADGTLQRRLVAHERSLYYGAQLDAPLPLGEIGPLALPYENYRLVFTSGLLAQIYAARVNDSLMQDHARYVHSENDSNWWMASGRPVFVLADRPRNPFVMPIGFEDPFGQISRVEYDDYNLLIAETRDPLGNTVRSNNHYRVLSPQLVTDANGNRTAVRFDALGLVVATFIMGKENDNDGDHFDQQSNERSETDNPTTTLEYDVFANLNDPAHRRPVYAHARRRERHRDDHSPWQHSYNYSDGFGREIQKKLLAEPGDVDGGFADPRWVGSGWTIFNNKGKPVKQYEPFFSPTAEFEFKIAGVGSTLFYDPLERVVATLHPNHTYEKVVFDPWTQETWDVNDTLNPLELYDPRTGTLPDFTFDPANDPDVGKCFQRLTTSDYLPTWYDVRMDPMKAADEWPEFDEQGHVIPGNVRRREAERRAAEKAARHAATPTTAHLDVLGRPFLTVANNGLAATGVVERHATRVALDIQGNQRSVIDALGRTVATYDYDMLSNRAHLASSDAGQRWMLNNAAGKRLRAWDDRDHHIRTLYDELQRPSHLFVQRGQSGEVLAERTVYGETLGDRAAGQNARGRPYHQYDGSGVVTHEAYDFKGNLTRTTRRLTTDYRLTVDWFALADLRDPADIDAAAAPLVERETFTSRTEYDALNRPISMLTLHNDRTPANEIRPGYNAANLIERLDVRLRGADTWTPFITNIDYNAKGQRTLIAYGILDDNGRSRVTSESTFDAKTFRLTRLRTTRTPNSDVQALEYVYDPIGNIAEIRDEAQQTTFFDNAVVDPHARYDYDAVYRLIAATGREHIGQLASPQVGEDDSPRMNQPHPGDGQAMRSYAERYDYDQAGNILRMIHTAGEGSWTRRYAYEAGSNRLLTTSLPGDDPLGPYSARYEYDAHGNITRMPHLAAMEWDFKDQLRVSQRQRVNNGGTPERTYYVYDAAGQRVRKVTDRQAAAGQTPTRANERVYFGDFEIYREYDATGANVTLERETLHVMDDKQRVAIVETKTVDVAASNFARRSLVRYQLANHLGSASLEVGESGEIMSYEEYHPYGSTSYQASRADVDAGSKRYRYTGIERDEESGLNYHSVRYYAPWLGRWTTCDPEELVDGPNVYRFARDNPIRFSDPSGAIPVAEPYIGESAPEITQLEPMRVTVPIPADAPPRPPPPWSQREIRNVVRTDLSGANTVAHVGGAIGGAGVVAYGVVALGVPAAKAAYLWAYGNALRIVAAVNFIGALLDPSDLVGPPIPNAGVADDVIRESGDAARMVDDVIQRPPRSAEIPGGGASPPRIRPRPGLGRGTAESLPNQYGDRVVRSGGRIRSLTGELSPSHLGTGTGTSRAAQRTAQEAHAVFDAGHLRARLLGGRGGLAGTFPQWSHVNRGLFSKFEQRLAELVEHASSTDRILFSVQPRYGGAIADVPVQVYYQVRINGVTVARALFSNQPGRSFLQFVQY